MIEYKTKNEIAKIEKASKLTAEIREVLVEFVKPGISTLELDHLTVKEMKKRNVQSVFLNYKPPFSDVAFPANVCVSVNEEIVHGIPKKNKILKEGDIVSIDLATRFEGYVGDTATTIGVGKISDQLKRFLKISQQCLWEGILKSVAGNHIGDVGHAIQKYLESHSLHVVKNFCGHGIGREMHEDPMIPHYGNPGEGFLLEPGIVYTIEPMICFESDQTDKLSDGWTIVSADQKPAAHFEHTLVITKNGPEVLTKL